MTSMIKVFIGDVKVDVPVCLNNDHPQSQIHSLSWLVNATLDIIKNKYKNKGFKHITIMNATTKCCGLTILPHTKLKDLFVDGHFPEIELFACIDKLLPVSSWTKFSHLGFPVTNTKIMKSEQLSEDEHNQTNHSHSQSFAQYKEEFGDFDVLIPDNSSEKSTADKYCNICATFEENICTLNIDITNQQIIEQFLNEEQIENINLTDVDVSNVCIRGNFNQWDEWIKLGQQRSKGEQHWTTTAKMNMNEKFSYDISCKINDENFESNNKERNEICYDVDREQDVRQFMTTKVIDPFLIHKIKTGKPKTLEAQLKEVIHDVVFKYLIKRMTAITDTQIMQCLTTHFREIKQLWIWLKCIHNIQNDAVNTMQYHTFIANIFPKEQKSIVNSFNVLNQIVNDRNKKNLSFTEFTAIMLYLSQQIFKNNSDQPSISDCMNRMMKAFGDKYLIYSVENHDVTLELLYSPEFALYAQVKNIFEEQVAKMAARCCLKGEMAVINIFEWVSFVQRWNLDAPEFILGEETKKMLMKFDALSKSDYISLFFGAQKINARLKVGLDELNGAEFLDLIVRTICAGLTMSMLPYRQKKTNVVLDLCKQISQQLNSVSFL